MTNKTAQGRVYFDQRKDRWIGIVDLGTSPEGRPTGLRFGNWPPLP